MSLTYANSARVEQYNILRGDHEALLEKHRKLSLNTQSLVDKVKLAEQGRKIAENRMAKVETLLKAAEFTISADTDELRDRLEKATEKKQDDMDEKVTGLLNVVKNNTMLFGRLQKKYDETTGDWVRARNLSIKLQKNLIEEKTQTKELSAKLKSEIKRVKADVKASSKRLNKDKKHKGATGKLETEILDYKGKVVRDSKIIEQLETELKANKKDMMRLSAKYADSNKNYLDYKREAEGLTDKMAIADKELEEAHLVIEGKKVSFKEEIEKEYSRKNKVWEKEIRELKINMETKESVMKQVRAQRESSEVARIELIKKYDLIEKTIVISENKMNTVIGKVASAKNKITSLNASTPYRPGAIERTLAGVMEDLKNV